MKKILVIGAGLYQVPLLERISALGHEVYCVDYNPQAVGFSKATGYSQTDVLDKEACLKALATVNAIAHDPEVGTEFVGKVTRILDFGAFVEYAPGKEGLCHISKLDKKRVAKVTDVVNVGDEIRVKIIKIDDKGRIDLSRAACLED